MSSKNKDDESIRVLVMPHQFYNWEYVLSTQLESLTYGEIDFLHYMYSKKDKKNKYAIDYKSIGATSDMTNRIAITRMKINALKQNSCKDCLVLTHSTKNCKKIWRIFSYF